MRTEMTSLLRYFVVFVVVLAGVIAFSVCAESPADACVLACCGGADRARPLGRFAAMSVSSACVAIARMSSGFRMAVASPALDPALLRASSLRI
jgi:hypothetical protein